MFSPLDKDDGMQNLNGTGDMEDLLTSNNGLLKNPASHGLNIGKENHPNGPPSVEAGLDRSKKQQKSTIRSNEPLSLQIQNDNADERVDRSTDYQGWLDAKKRKWKYVREQKKRRR